jgi:hypothetical protein
MRLLPVVLAMDVPIAEKPYHAIPNRHRPDPTCDARRGCSCRVCSIRYSPFRRGRGKRSSLR